ncbi:MAG: toxin-antitoxin system YwqK family antitoxin [Bacteroidota bacterium]
MKISLLISAIFFCITVAYNQNVGQVGDSLINYMDINGNKQGHWQKKYENEKIAYNAYFKNGKIIGQYIRYYSSGKIKADVIYDKEGNQTGKAKLYWDDGIIMAEGNYIDMNVKDSIWNFYGVDGKLLSTVSYKKDILDGESISYYRDGKKSELITYKNGVKDGLWRRYFESGETNFEVKMTDNHMDGVMNVYYKSGRPKVKGKYSKGIKIGKFILYDSNGKVESEIEYKKGVASNEKEVNAKLAKEIIDAENNKDRYKEPSENDFYKSQQPGEY